MEALISNPGLSHLATKIFFLLDLESFSRLELVCKSWRFHVINSALWRHKLNILARATSFNMELIEEALEGVMDKEDFHRKCKPLCRDMTVRQRWLDPNIKVRAAKVFEVSSERGHVHDFVIAGNKEEEKEMVFIDWDGNLCARRHSPCEGEWVTRLRPDDPVVSLDVHGDYVAVGTSRGAVGIYDWSRRCWLPEARMVPSREGRIRKVKFSHDGGTLISVSVHKNEADQEWSLQVWRFSGERLNLVQQLDDVEACAVDVSQGHLVYIRAEFICNYTQTNTGTYVEAGRCEADHAKWQHDVRVLKNAPSAVTWNTFVKGLKFWDLRPTSGGDIPLIGHYPLPENMAISCVAECPRTGVLAVRMCRLWPHGCTTWCSVALLSVPVGPGGPITAMVVSFGPMREELEHWSLCSASTPGSFHMNVRNYRDIHGEFIVVTVSNAGRNDDAEAGAALAATEESVFKKYALILVPERPEEYS